MKARSRRSATIRRANCSKRPQEEAVKSRRDSAILSTLLFHALRREVLCRRKMGHITLVLPEGSIGLSCVNVTTRAKA